MCTDGSCVKLYQLCDDRFDCADGVDEGRFCTAIDQCKGFMCLDDSRCLRWSQVCDQHMNCFDGSDEFNCELPPPNIETTCPAQEFMCSHSHQCVTISACCDGVQDCDELVCNRKLNTPDNPCIVGEFWCVDGTRCLPTLLFATTSNIVRMVRTKLPKYAKKLEYKFSGDNLLHWLQAILN